MTSSNSRPPLARKHNRSTEKSRQDELDKGVRITSGDDVFEVRVGDVSPALTAELRRNTGMSFRRLMEVTSEDPDVDVLTALEWLSRRIRGEEIEFEEVAMTYQDVLGDGFDIDMLDPRKRPADAPEPDAGDDPEA